MKENAYFTVEAGLVLSVVFFVFYFVIYIGFYQYNRCLLNQDIYRLLIRAEQAVYLDDAQLIQEIKRQDSEWYYEKYLLCRWKRHEVSVGKGKVKIGKTCIFETGMHLFPMWGKNREWEIGADYTGKRLCPEKIIREYRKIQHQRGKNG